MPDRRPAIASAMDSDLDYLRARLTGSIRSAGAQRARIDAPRDVHHGQDVTIVARGPRGITVAIPPHDDYPYAVTGLYQPHQIVDAGADALPTLTIVDVTDDDDTSGDDHADRMHALARRRFTIERDGGPWAPYGCAGDVVALVVATTCPVDLVRVARLLDAIPASAPSFAAQFVTRAGATLIVRRTA